MQILIIIDNVVGDVMVIPCVGLLSRDCSTNRWWPRHDMIMDKISGEVTLAQILMIDYH